MLTLLLSNWRTVLIMAMLTIMAALVGYYRWQADRWEKKFYTFEAQVKVLGEAAKEKALAQEAADKLRRDTADAEHKAAVANLATTIKRLRDERSRSNYLPPAAPGAIRPDLACFARADLERTLSGFVEGAAGLAEEGDAAIADLNSARKWAQAR